ncbi:hypothetical protein AAVH_26156 [Aphelenchoides avenae]|nr:hypothetical protein AAVH_26156 [Aphelenchus avenae]
MTKGRGRKGATITYHISYVSNELNFKVGLLHYSDHLQETETLERSVNWIVRDLHVTDYELSMRSNGFNSNKRAVLPTTLTHDSVRATAEYLYVHVKSGDAVIFEQLFGLLFDAPKLAAVLRFRIGCRPANGKGKKFAELFIRRFIAGNDVSRIARSVSILQRFKGDDAHSYLPEMCVSPRQQSVDAPKMHSLQKLFSARIKVQKCDLYVFKNDASGKELQLFATTAREVFKTYGNDLFIITLIIV